MLLNFDAYWKSEKKGCFYIAICATAHIKFWLKRVATHRTSSISRVRLFFKEWYDVMTVWLHNQCIQYSKPLHNKKLTSSFKREAFKKWLNQFLCIHIVLLWPTKTRLLLPIFFSPNYKLWWHNLNSVAGHTEPFLRCIVPSLRCWSATVQHRMTWNQRCSLPHWRSLYFQQWRCIGSISGPILGTVNTNRLCRPRLLFHHRGSQGIRQAYTNSSLRISSLQTAKAKSTATRKIIFIVNRGLFNFFF